MVESVSTSLISKFPCKDPVHSVLLAPRTYTTTQMKGILTALGTLLFFPSDIASTEAVSHALKRKGNLRAPLLGFPLPK
jgi:hypothetical protein